MHSRFCLTTGADDRGRDVGGKTPVMYAASNVDCEILGLLLQHGAELKSVDTDGRGPLMHAIMNEKASMDDKVRILVMLLREGADVASTGETVGCLRHATLAGQNRILELLVQHSEDSEVEQRDSVHYSEYWIQR